MTHWCVIQLSYGQKKYLFMRVQTPLILKNLSLTFFYKLIFFIKLFVKKSDFMFYFLTSYVSTNLFLQKKNKIKSSLDTGKVFNIPLCMSCSVNKENQLVGSASFVVLRCECMFYKLTCIVFQKSKFASYVHWRYICKLVQENVDLKISITFHFLQQFYSFYDRGFSLRVFSP